MNRVAVDFGTSNTVLAVHDPSSPASEIETLELPGITRPLHYRLSRDDSPRTVHVTPTLIHYGESETLIGEQVNTRGLSDHPDTIRWVKRRIALGVGKRKKTVRGHVSYEEAGRDFLTTLLTYASDRLVLAEDEYTFTAPVESFENFEDWLRRVARELGIRRMRIQDEATACILGDHDSPVRPEDRFVVFDFGCGTLDVSAVRLDLETPQDRKAVPLGQAGLDLGGMDIDSWILDDFCRRNQLDARLRRQSENALSSRAEALKIALSDPQVHEAELEFADYRTRYLESCERCRDGRQTENQGAPSPCLGCILRDRDFLRQVRETVDRALENAAIQSGLRRHAVTRVLTTGGTSLVPSVQRCLEESFPDRVSYDRPFDAVVRGACRGLVVPTLQHDYAIESFDRARRDFEFKPLFRRGMSYPTAPAARVRFWAKGSHDGMTRIGIKIFEVSGMKRRTLDVSLVDFDGTLRDTSRVDTDFEYVCLNRDNPTFILADPPVVLERDAKRFLCSFRVDSERRLLVTVEDRLRGATLLVEHPVVRL